MRKKGYTLVELMVSVSVLLIILGVLGITVTSYMDPYSEGIKNEETGNQTQTFFSYVIGDLNLKDYDGTGGDQWEGTEGDDEKSFQIIKVVKNGIVKEFRISERSWDMKDPKDEIVYRFESRGVTRNGKLILKGNKSFDLQGMDLQIYKNEIKENIRIKKNAISYGNNIDISSKRTIPLRKDMNTNDDKEYNYYIKPSLNVGGKDYSRGYAFRFSNLGATDEEIVPPEEPELEAGIVTPPGVGRAADNVNINKLDIPINRKYWLIITFDSETFWHKTDDGTKWEDIIKGYVFNKVELFEVANSSILHSRYDVIETEEESKYTGQKRMKFYFETEVGIPPGNSDVIILQIHPTNRYMYTEFEYYFKYRYD